MQTFCVTVSSCNTSPCVQAENAELHERLRQLALALSSSQKKTGVLRSLARTVERMRHGFAAGGAPSGLDHAAEDEHEELSEEEREPSAAAEDEQEGRGGGEPGLSCSGPEVCS